jgi:hypothetical protein
LRNGQPFNWEQTISGANGYYHRATDQITLAMRTPSRGGTIPSTRDALGVAETAMHEYGHRLYPEWNSMTQEFFTRQYARAGLNPTDPLVQARYPGGLWAENLWADVVIWHAPGAKNPLPRGGPMPPHLRPFVPKSEPGEIP